MKVPIISIENKETGKVDLPLQFNEELRTDLIKLAVLAIQGNRRQGYGNLDTAGKRQSAEVSRRRRDYRGSYGQGISRVPRKIMSRSGRRFNWVGAVAPGTKGGRRAHPPKIEKNWSKSMNIKERRKAIRSAMAANMDKKLVLARGHQAPENYPFIIDNQIENFKKTKEVIDFLNKIGLEQELITRSVRSIRAGKGKLRGRKYKGKISALIVVSKKCPLQTAASNILGIAITEARNLNAEKLAPAGVPGRLTLWTQDAIKQVKEKNLFM